MRGLNKIVISGNVGGRINSNHTKNGTKAYSFQLASDRHTKGVIITVWVKINVYRADLVNVCDAKLHEGCYVMVEGELMNRDLGEVRDIVEVRAHELIFIDTKRRESLNE